MFVRKIRAFNVAEIDTWNEVKEPMNLILLIYFNTSVNKAILQKNNQLRYGAVGWVGVRIVP